MHPIYRRIAIAAFAIVGGLCFAFLAPVVVAPFVLPTGLVNGVGDFMEHFNKIERAGFIINGLWLAGVATAAIGALYGLVVAVFSKSASSPSSSKP